MSDKDDEVRDALADLILGAERPDLARYMPASKPSRPWYRPNGKQAMFGLVVGICALLIAMVEAQDYDGHPLPPSLIGIVAIAWALGYRRDGTAG